jgi:hypothetical protein
MEDKKDYTQLFRSRTFWLLVLAFVVNGFSGIRDSIPAGLLPYLDGVFAILTIYTSKVAPRVNL